MLCSSLSEEIEKCYPQSEWVEVPSDHIYSITFPVHSVQNKKPEFELQGNAEDINDELCNFYLDNIVKHSWCFPTICRIPAETVIINDEKQGKEFELSIPSMFLPYGARSKDLITNYSDDHDENEFSEVTKKFIEVLGEAVRRRVNAIPDRHKLPEDYTGRGGEARLAIMFSGGIDSMLVATLATKYFPAGEPIE